MREVEKQAERFVRKKEEEIVKPDGMLEKGLWYRKVKGESKLGGDRVVVEESDMNRTGLIGSS